MSPERDGPLLSRCPNALAPKLVKLPLISCVSLCLIATLVGCDLMHLTLQPNHPTATTSSPPHPMQAQQSGTQITIFLPRLLEDDSLRLEPVPRTIAPSSNSARDALQALVDGPTGDERAADLEYALDRLTQI